MLEPSNQPTPVKLTRRDVAMYAFSVERDLRGVVETLTRTIDLVDTSDLELVERLSNTKAVAQRGLRLSKLLVNLTRRRPG